MTEKKNGSVGRSTTCRLVLKRHLDGFNRVSPTKGNRRKMAEDNLNLSGLSNEVGSLLSWETTLEHTEKESNGKSHLLLT